MMHYIERDGKPVAVESVLEWAKWHETADRVIAKTELAGWGNMKGKGCDISTVFLGTDHNFGRKGDPILYETLVFGGPLDQEMERYCTREAAAIGHKLMCLKCEIALKEREANGQ